MDPSLHEVWQSASGSPFLPTVGKGSQFFIGFVLLLVGILLSGLFALSESPSFCGLAMGRELTKYRSVLRQHPSHRYSRVISSRVRFIYRLPHSNLANSGAGLVWSTCSALSESTYEIPRAREEPQAPSKLPRKNKLYHSCAIQEHPSASRILGAIEGYIL